MFPDVRDLADDANKMLRITVSKRRCPNAEQLCMRYSTLGKRETHGNSGTLAVNNWRFTNFIIYIIFVLFFSPDLP